MPPKKRRMLVTRIRGYKKEYCVIFLSISIKSRPPNIRKAPHPRVIYIMACKSLSDKHVSPSCTNGVNVAIVWIKPIINIPTAVILPKKICNPVFILLEFLLNYV